MRFDVLSWNRLRYNLWAPIYASVAGATFDRMRRRAIRLLNLTPGERLLIAGAGPGLEVPYIPSGVSVTAIDAAPGMIKRLRHRARSLGIAVDARVMDAQAQDFPDGAFDAAVLSLILAVVPDPVRCGREVARVLRPGGRAVIFDKFLPDTGPVPLPIRIANPITRLVGTDITRRLGPILADSGLRLVHEEPAGLGGFLKIALAVRPE